MLFSFARISAVLSLKRGDFYYQGPRRWLRFHEKGGKEHEMPAHHEIEETIDQYLARVSIEDKQPLFQSVNKTGTALSGRALNRHNAWAAIRKRARNAGFLTPVGSHTWRATGVTVYLENGGRFEHAQQMAAHESPRTTKLYDRTKDEITIGEIERIQL
jgi:integrase